MTHHYNNLSKMAQPTSNIRYSRKAAFTLAEVLITLGIIGVVAALTIPTLIANHKAQVVEKKLAKFYTNMNQAITLSESENGPHENWDYNLSSYDFYNTYLAKYLNTFKVMKGFTANPNDDRFVGIYFPDGTMAVIGYTTRVGFFPKAKREYNSVFGNIVLENQNTHKYGKDMFPFTMCTDSSYKFEPRGKAFCANSGSLDDQTIYDDCKNPDSGLYCTELIRRNGWKIPENYPIKL